MSSIGITRYLSCINISLAPKRGHQCLNNVNEQHVIVILANFSDSIHNRTENAAKTLKTHLSFAGFLYAKWLNVFVKNFCGITCISLGRNARFVQNVMKTMQGKSKTLHICPAVPRPAPGQDTWLEMTGASVREVEYGSCLGPYTAQ